MQWKHHTSPPVVKFRKNVSASKVMVSVFWDSEGVLFTDYLEKGKTVTGVYYAGLIRKLREVIKQKWRVASPRQCSSAHLSCCRDHYPWLWLRTPLAPTLFTRSRSVRFPSVQTFKGITSSTGFEDDEAVTVAVNEWIEERHQNFLLEGVKTLEQRWETFIALRGNYVEKRWHDFGVSLYFMCFSHYLLNAPRISRCAKFG